MGRCEACCAQRALSLPHLFWVMVQLRLHKPVAPTDAACPLCDGVTDSHGDHSRCCPCRGGRVKHRNRLRAVVAVRAQGGISLVPSPQYETCQRSGIETSLRHTMFYGECLITSGGWEKLLRGRGLRQLRKP